ncbi:MAG: phosphoribosyl-AMP cyclohydrolase, partial [Dechloromonas sp.]|nr:phosphoribosyl-AMP cyclohydrolase [Dechloromonas sp.]
MSDLDNALPWLEALKWDADGMIPAIAQDENRRVVMFAYMNRESLQETVRCGNAVYWSRSRQRLWRKGEESGHFQKIRSIRTDCDGDVL